MIAYGQKSCQALKGMVTDFSKVLAVHIQVQEMYLESYKLVTPDKKIRWFY